MQLCVNAGMRPCFEAPRHRTDAGPHGFGRAVRRDWDRVVGDRVEGRRAPERVPGRHRADVRCRAFFACLDASAETLAGLRRPTALDRHALRGERLPGLVGPEPAVSARCGPDESVRFLGPARAAAVRIDGPQLPDLAQAPTRRNPVDRVRRAPDWHADHRTATRRMVDSAPPCRSASSARWGIGVWCSPTPGRPQTCWRP